MGENVRLPSGILRAGDEGGGALLVGNGLRTMPVQPRVLSQPNLSLGRGLRIAGRERSAGLGERLLARGLALRERAAVPELHIGAVRVVGRPQLEGGSIEPGRGRERSERHGAIGGRTQRAARALGDAWKLPARGRGELERLEVVMGDRLGVVVGSPERLDPFRRRPVLVGAAGARDLRVGDVTDEQVPERVFALLAHRRAPLPADELLPLEGVQRLLGLRPVTVADPGDSPEPEDLADDGRVLEQELLDHGQTIEAGGDDPLHGLGQLRLAVAPGSELGEHSRELFGVERVAAGMVDQRRLNVGREHGALEQRVDELGGLVVRERRE